MTPPKQLACTGRVTVAPCWTTRVILHLSKRRTRGVATVPALTWEVHVGPEQTRLFESGIVLWVSLLKVINKVRHHLSTGLLVPSFNVQILWGEGGQSCSMFQITDFGARTEASPRAASPIPLRRSTHTTGCPSASDAFMCQLTGCSHSMWLQYSMKEA